MLGGLTCLLGATEEQKQDHDMNSPTQYIFQVIRRTTVVLSISVNNLVVLGTGVAFRRACCDLTGMWLGKTQEGETNREQSFPISSHKKQ